jgi:hypothetical protein
MSDRYRENFVLTRHFFHNFLEHNGLSVVVHSRGWGDRHAPPEYSRPAGSWGLFFKRFPSNSQRRSPMSQIQPALFRNDCDCAKPAVPISQMCRADAPDAPDKICGTDTSGEPDRRQHRASSIVSFILKSLDRVDRPATRKAARLKSARVARANALGKGMGSEDRNVCSPCNESVSAQPRPQEDESLAAQIRRFRERTDLRECLLPGMVGRISPKACQGWQRQASVRNSRVLAKIKLGSCKNCQYALEPAPGRVGQSVAKVVDRRRGLGRSKSTLIRALW